MPGQVIGAKLALFLGPQIVVLLRDDKPGLLWPGYWDLPGGGIEAGETPLECVLRETREEIDLTLPESAVHWGRCYPTSSGDQTWFFAAKAAPELAKQIVLGDEGQAVELWSPSAFLAHDKAVPQFKPRLMDVLNGADTQPIERR